MGGAVCHPAIGPCHCGSDLRTLRTWSRWETHSIWLLRRPRQNGMRFYADVGELADNDRYSKWRNAVNSEWVPTIAAVKTHIDAEQEDYRFMTAEHPLEAYRDRTQPSSDYPAQS